MPIDTDLKSTLNQQVTTQSGAALGDTIEQVFDGIFLAGTGSITVPALLSLTIADVGNITVTGLVDGDFVYVTPPNAAFEDGMMYSCYVSAPNTLTINVLNGSLVAFSGSTADWRYFVHKSF